MKFIKKLFEPVLSEKEKFKNVYNKMITEWEELEQKKKELIDSKASELKIEALNNLQLDLLDAFDILRESMVLELVDDELYKLNKIPGSIGCVFEYRGGFGVDYYLETTFLTTLAFIKLSSKYINIVNKVKDNIINHSKLKKHLKKAINAKNKRKDDKVKRKVLTDLGIEDFSIIDIIDDVVFHIYDGATRGHNKILIERDKYNLSELSLNIIKDVAYKYKVDILIK